MQEQLDAIKAKARTLAADLRAHQPDVTRQGAYCDRLDALVADLEALEVPDEKKAGAK